jgi:hypothetical protein
MCNPDAYAFLARGPFNGYVSFPAASRRDETDNSSTAQTARSIVDQRSELIGAKHSRSG